MTDIRLAAIVPAYDAAATIADVVRGTLAVVPDVLVVDDGSRDATGARAREAGATVIRLEPNAGKGAALVRGFHHWEARDFTHAVTLDADGQHYPDEIGALARATALAPDAIVVGVRRKEGQTISAIARLGNWVADTLVQQLAGQSLPDTQSGFRVYPLAATIAIPTIGRRYDFETEILFRAARRGIPVVGVPVRVFYPPIADRVTHFDPWWDTLRIIGTVLHALATS